jgi:hypothetical protein
MRDTLPAGTRGAMGGSCTATDCCAREVWVHLTTGTHEALTHDTPWYCPQSASEQILVAHSP